MGRPLRPPSLRWRAHPLDGSLLLFDRRTGTNALLSGAETAGLVRGAPRLVQIAITNACNKSCSFCYRPLDAPSRWTFDALLDLARFCDEWGVLEVTFGGGEPTLFPRFAELLQAIWSETSVCPSFTTNGLRLTPKLLRAMRGSYGQIQLSVYDEDDTMGVIDLLVAEKARFGLNYLVTPSRARSLEADVIAFVRRGVRDILFLSYKGADDLHLSRRECAMFDESVAKLHRMFGGEVSFKVDVCWAGRLVETPQLLNEPDCQANDDFLSITSDKRVLACSFSPDGVAFDSPRELRAIYDGMRRRRLAAPTPGCARLPGFGLEPQRRAARRALPLAR